MLPSTSTSTAAGLLFGLLLGACATGTSAAADASGDATDATSSAHDGSFAEEGARRDASLHDATTPTDARAEAETGGHADAMKVDAGAKDAARDAAIDVRRDGEPAADGARDAGRDAVADRGDSGADGALGGNGDRCVTGATCASGYCANDVCCNVACDSTCKACTAALTGMMDGVCADVTTGSPAPAGQCPVAPCGNDGNCNAGGCEQVAEGATCGAAGTCSAGVETPPSMCGGGTCNAQTEVMCGAYACNSAGTACLTHCSADSDCSSLTDFCLTPGAATGVCTPRLATSAPCTSSDQCASGYCYGAPTTCQANSCGDGVMDGDETGVDCGGPVCAICPTVLLIGAGASGSVGAELHPTTGQNGTWSATTSLAAPSVSDLGVAFTGSGPVSTAVGVLRYTQMGASLDQALVFATWAPGAATLSGTWVPFAAVGSTVTTREVPAVTGSAGTAFVSFQGNDYNLYFAEYQAGAWSPAAEAVGAGTVATPAGIAVVGTTPTVAYFAHTTNYATAEDRATSWQTAITLDTLASDTSFVATPSIVAMNGGTATELMAFIRQSDGGILFATRSGGTWSTTASVPGATAPASATYGPVERVGLAALSGGGAIVSWRDRTTNGIYYSLYTAGVWSASPIPYSNPNIVVGAAPAVAHGVAGATAEMAFVESSGVAYHTRLIAGAWTPPVAVGGASLSHVTLAAAP